MSCSPEHLKDYFFGELAPADRLAMEHHLTACSGCREDLSALGNTRAALMSLREEEPPRRIAFVSDKVFEPRWWQRVWQSGPKLGFASAGLVAMSILMHGWMVRPVAASTASVASPQMAVTTVDVEAKVRAEVAKAVAQNEAKQLRQVLELVNTRLQETDQNDRQKLVLMQEYLERMEKRNARVARSVLYE